MNYKNIQLFAIILVLLFMACSFNINKDKELIYKLSRIDIYLNETLVSRQFEKIDVILVQDDGTGKYNSETLNKALEQAVKLNAEGLIIESTQKKITTYIPFDQADLSLKKNVYKYIAIKYITE